MTRVKILEGAVIAACVAVVLSSVGFLLLADIFAFFLGCSCAMLVIAMALWIKEKDSA